MSTLKNSQKTFWLWLSIFLIISGIIILLKQNFDFPDKIDRNSFVLVLSPIIFIFAILIAYWQYDKLAKQAKSSDDEPLQWKLFSKATKIKMIILTLGGLAMSFSLLLYWKKDYLYALGMILIFYFLAYPTQLKFDQQFSDNLEKRYMNREHEQAAEETGTEEETTEKE